VKVTVLTACYNSAKTLGRTLESVKNQTYPEIEHIVLDGGSTDDTKTVVSYYKHVTRFISEKDQGVYDALNKGIQMATGDVISILHADDHYKDKHVIQDMIEKMQETLAMGVYGDIEFVNEHGRRIRYYSSNGINLNSFKRGIMPAHPSCFFRTALYKEFPFNLKYKIASDFDQVLKCFLKYGDRLVYTERITTSMLPGGLSTASWKSNVQLNKEALDSLRANGLSSNIFLIYSKYFSKILGFLNRG
jgi:glycosyltransferase involved in cell wall biosynthesis